MQALAVLRRHAGDALIVAIAAASLIEVAVSETVGSKAALAAALLGATLPLLARRRFPLAAPSLTMLVMAASSFFLADGLRTLAIPVFVVFFAAWALGRGNERGRALVGLAISYACVQTLTAHFGDTIQPGDVIFSFMIVAAPWLGGVAVRARAERTRELHERAARLELERETTARSAVADERARIARELHDVVAHSISVMTIQAGAARLLLDDDPRRAEEPLVRVEETGRQTLAELRRLLGVLRRDMNEAAGLEPRPSLERIDGLLDQYRSSGLDVGIEVAGTPSPLPAGVDQAAYRVVQEALTNSLKHGRATTATVRIAYEDGGISLEIVDDGRASPGAKTTTGGHGLVGMRERVDLYGGRLETGPRESGGFAVRARFPVESAA